MGNDKNTTLSKSPAERHTAYTQHLSRLEQKKTNEYKWFDNRSVAELSVFLAMYKNMRKKEKNNDDI